jgi:hypothetical protein
MPFVPVPNAVLVESRMLLDSQHIENTLWFRREAGVLPANMSTLIDAVSDWWTAHMAPLTPNVVLLTEFVATDMTVADSFQVSLAPLGGIPGSVASPALPNNVSLAVSFRTGLRGRSFRGRNYVSALWEAGVDGNTVGPTIVAAFQAAYEELITDTGIAGTGYVWGVASRFSGVTVDHHPIPRSTGLFTPISGVVVVDPTVDSMRRRLPGRGT